MFCFLVTAETSPELRIDTTRNVLRQLNRTYKKTVTLYTVSIHEHMFLQKDRLSLYPLIRFNTNTFYEYLPWMIYNNPSILPHQSVQPNNTRFCRSSVDGQIVHIRHMHHNKKRSMIQKYSMFEKKQKTYELCASLHVDMSVVMKSFERADKNNDYRYMCSIYNHYGYYIYGRTHRANNTDALLYTTRKYRYVIAELQSRTKRCEFPNCTHYYAEPMNRWSPLCSVHGRVWNEAFKSIIRPSTVHLLQSAPA